MDDAKNLIFFNRGESKDAGPGGRNIEFNPEEALLVAGALIIGAVPQSAFGGVYGAFVGLVAFTATVLVGLIWGLTIYSWPPDQPPPIYDATLAEQPQQDEDAWRDAA